mmetsp:Transcript_47122/g.112160  ORF Transcript_47122/g.112160 Transcript_47122/m.112160 type:complete len:358 (-) Transcript_47122:3082-4155(-)
MSRSWGHHDRWHSNRWHHQQQSWSWHDKPHSNNHHSRSSWEDSRGRRWEDRQPRSQESRRIDFRDILEKPVIDRVEELNRSQTLCRRIQLELVATSLSSISGESAFVVLAELEEDAAKVPDPTVWVIEQAKAIAAKEGVEAAPFSPLADPGPETPEDVEGSDVECIAESPAKVRRVDPSSEEGLKAELARLDAQIAEEDRHVCPASRAGYASIATPSSQASTRTPCTPPMAAGSSVQPRSPPLAPMTPADAFANARASRSAAAPMVPVTPADAFAVPRLPRTPMVPMTPADAFVNPQVPVTPTVTSANQPAPQTPMQSFSNTRTHPQPQTPANLLRTPVPSTPADAYLRHLGSANTS